MRTVFADPQDNDRDFLDWLQSTQQPDTATTGADRYPFMAVDDDLSGPTAGPWRVLGAHLDAGTARRGAG